MYCGVGAVEGEDSCMTLDDFLQSQEFYKLMQWYRHAPVTNPAAVVEAFEAVKTALLEAHALAPSGPKADSQ